MSFTLHQEALNKLCRLCGRLASKSSSIAHVKQTAVPVNSYSKKIYELLQLSVWLDDDQVHPINLCWRCTRFLREESLDKAEHRESSPVSWEKHSRTGTCKTCEVYIKLCRGGRPAKRKRSGYGLPNVAITQTQLSVVETGPLSFNIASFESDLVPLNLDILHSATEESLFVCSICQCILGSPAVQTDCEHNFCAECLLGWFQHMKSKVVKCPVCNLEVNIQDVTVSPRVLRVQLQSLQTVCIQCGSLGKLEQMKRHVCPPKIRKPSKMSAVFYAPDAPIESQQKSSTQATEAARLLKSLASQHTRGDPIPPEIEEAADRWTWLKLKQTQNAKLKTLGRVSKNLKKKHFRS